MSAIAGMQSKLQWYHRMYGTMLSLSRSWLDAQAHLSCTSAHSPSSLAYLQHAISVPSPGRHISVHLPFP